MSNYFAERSIFDKSKNIALIYYYMFSDKIRAYKIQRDKNSWPCLKKVYLLVGGESSGTTAVSKLLLDSKHMRFLDEGPEKWVWEVYKSVYLKRKSIRDYPSLQLFDSMKVPGFAVILEEFRAEFPNSTIIYLVRDPRDVVNSAIKTFKVSSVADLATTPWVSETWLGIPDQDPVIRLAKRWKIYLQKSYKVEDVVYVRYEDFCQDKVQFIKDLAERFGLDFDSERVSRLCDTQLIHQSARDYKPTGPGGYLKGIMTQEDILKIEKVCRDEMLKWGYQLSNERLAASR